MVLGKHRSFICPGANARCIYTPSPSMLNTVVPFCELQNPRWKKSPHCVLIYIVSLTTRTKALLNCFDSSCPARPKLARMYILTAILALGAAIGTNAQNSKFNTNLSEIEGYSGSSCKNYKATWVTMVSNDIREDGQCFSFPKNGYPAIKVSSLASSRGCEGKQKLYPSPAPICYVDG